MPESLSRCCYCNSEDGPGDKALRPYGPNHSPICFECASSTEERMQATEEMIRESFVSAIGLGVIIIRLPETDEPVAIEEVECPYCKTFYLNRQPDVKNHILQCQGKAGQ